MTADDLSIILIDRDADLAARLVRVFSDIGGLDVCRESTLDHALERFEHGDYDILLIASSAFQGGQLTSAELLEVIAAISPTTQVLFLAESRDIQAATDAPHTRNCHYIELPVSDEDLRARIETIAHSISDRPQRRRPHSERPVRPEPLIGRSQPMRELRRQIRQATATDIPVLLLGDTGTGKDLVAEIIHYHSQRGKGPYVPVNLGAIPPDLVASELFGHEKGAFTSATSKHIGRFEQANGGTIFLDEIDTVDEKVQISLLRIIEEQEFERLGGQNTIRSNARIIVASNRDLSQAVERATFREDLFYRLDVFRILIAPLRQRRDDIPLLIDAFVKHYNRTLGKNISGIAPEAIGLLQSYDWPGNVRELKNVCHRAVLVCEGEVVHPEHLPPRFRPQHAKRPQVVFELGTPLSEIEREMIVRALAATKNNRTQAAKLLGISRRALYNKLRRYGIK
ncbi:MAG: sigma-54-dependent Fis family transcriptional regulator [Planctomycetes bacterium]|nr:sigma-54-dependent Fis family transcriptional regulator [Planctomycetota bacterium]